MNITEANNRVLEAIESVGDGTILGLLPITREDQDAIVRAVRDFLKGNTNCLQESLSRCAPAASAFAVALAPSRAMEDGNFYQSLIDELGVDMPPQHRASFSSRFQEACTLLGLPTGNLGALPNIAPILYQSGILPHWVKPLCDAVRRTLKKTPIADPDSMQYMERIRIGIIGRINPTQTRLLDCMGHEVGTQVVRRMLQAAIHHNYSSLPPHLAERIEETLQGEPPKFLAIPHLAFDASSGMIELVLPKQNEDLLLDASTWDVNGRRYTAGSERRLCVEDLGVCEATVRLRELAGELEDQEFHIAWHFDSAHPFRLYNRRDGREKKGLAAGQATVKAGEYFLLGIPGMTIQGVKTADISHETKFDWTEIDVAPGTEIRITIDGAHHAISATTEPSIAFRCEESATTADGERILYSDDVRVEVYFPTAGLAQADSGIEIVVSTPLSPDKKLSAVVNGDELLDDANGVLSERGSAALRTFTATLAPGIHHIQLIATGAARRTSAKMLYWKGLQHISESRGFICGDPGINVDPSRCRGLIFEEERIAWSPEFHAPFATLYSTSLRRSIEFPRPGVSMLIQDRNEDWTEILPAGSSIELAHPEDRVVRFLSGGFEDWEISCGEVLLCLLKAARPQQTLSLAGLAGQLGESGRISARRSNGQDLHLFSFFRPHLAHDLQVEADPAYRLHRATFRVGASRMVTLGVRITDELKDPPAPAALLPLELPADGSDEAITTFEGSLTISVGRASGDTALRVEVTAPFDAVTDRLLVVDFVLKPEGGNGWRPIQVAEQHGTSSLRLILSPVDWPEPCGAWQSLLRHAATHYAHAPEMLQPQLGNIDLVDLARILARTTSMLHFKYPSAVWNDGHDTVRWFQEVPILLAANRFHVRDGSAKTWAIAAVQELEARSRQTNAAVVSQILLASVYQLMRAPGQLFENDGNGIIEGSFDASAKIANAPTLADFARAHDAARSVAFDVYPFFENYASVSGGGEPHLRRFQWGRFIADIWRRGDILARDVPRIDVYSLLSPEHILYSLRMLNRRTRAFRETGHGADPDHPLRGIKQAVLKMHLGFENRVNALHGDLGFPNHFGEHLLFPGAENSWCGRVAQIIFLISGLGRLAGYGRRTPEWFDAQARDLLLHNHGIGMEDQTEKLRNALCILLSLAPELYAYFHLVWTVVLKDGDDE